MKRILLLIGILVSGGLAYVHWVLPGTVEASMNIVLPHEPYAVSDEARKLHDSLFVVDLHSDSLLWKRDLTKKSDIGHMDVPRLKAVNVALQVFSATTKTPSDMNYSSNTPGSDDITLLAIASMWPPRTWSSLYDRAVYQIDKLYRVAERSDLVVIRNRQDLEGLVASRSKGESAL